MQEQTQTLGTTPPTAPAADELADLIVQAKARIEEGDLEGGLDAFRAIAESNPDLPEVFNNLGAICAAMGRREEAEQAFGRAAELSPQTPNPIYNRGLMRFQGGNFLGAREDFSRAAGLAPDDPEVQNNLGVALFQLEELDEARVAFERAVALRPDYLAAQLNVVDIDLARGDIEDACARCRTLAESTEEPEAWAKLVDCTRIVALQAVDRAATEAQHALRRVDAASPAHGVYGQLLRARLLLGADAPDDPAAPLG